MAIRTARSRGLGGLIRTLNERLDDADDDVLHHHHHQALHPKPDGTPYSVAL